MKVWPSYPDENDLSLAEVFFHDRFVSGDAAAKERIGLASAQFRYDYEKQHGFFEHYFPHVSAVDLRGRSILDLGCFSGGRLVQWMEKYGFSEGHGIDLHQAYIDAARKFAEIKGVNAHFGVSFGERLPFEDDRFDVIVTYDVFEHVKDVQAVLDECRRTLVPGGKLFCVFPQFYQPFEAHLGLVTKVPLLHWFFPSEAITHAYFEITSERGPDAKWYAIRKGSQEPWEKLPSLNGITARRFRKMVRQDSGWDLTFWGTQPILSDGRRANQPAIRLLRKLFALPAKLPLLEELTLGRICCELTKR